MSGKAGGYIGPYRATSTSPTSASGIWSLVAQQQRVGADIWPPSALQFVICGTAAEGGTLSLTAPPGTVFTTVTFASWGNWSGSCGSFSQGGCHASNSLSIVNSYLIGKSGTVTIPANNSVFGDPCLGSYKALAVEVICM